MNVSQERKHFFFEKKKQKTFDFKGLILCRTAARRVADAWSERRHSHSQKFFGSFLQKRTASFLGHTRLHWGDLAEVDASSGSFLLIFSKKKALLAYLLPLVI